MLSTQYRLRLEFICKCIANGEEVKLDDMIWAEKLSKANTSAREMLKKARRAAANPDIQEGSMDDFMNKMGLGDPDPSNHKTGFDGADEIVDWFQRDKPDDWRQQRDIEEVFMILKPIPWSKLHEIAEALDGKLVHITCVDHTGRDYKRIVIEYEEEKK